jgi:hypothetical protein
MINKSLHLLIFTFCGLFSLQVSAREADYQMRVSWVKELKQLMLVIEAKQSDRLMTQTERQFRLRFQLFAEAWASGEGRHDCFFAGWPSALITSKGKRLCSSPERGSANYSRGNCQTSELQCQPLLFGSNLCVSFASSEDKKFAFSKCESKFQTERQGSYDFLRELTPENADALRELSLLAGSICESGDIGVQKNSGMCKNLLSKLTDALKSVERGRLEGLQRESATERAAEEVVAAVVNPGPKEKCDCDEDKLPSVATAALEVKSDADKIVYNSVDQLYEQMKEKFQNSHFCDPQNVLNDPAEKPNGLLMGQFLKDLNFLDFGSDSARLQSIATKYQLPDTALQEASPLLQQLRSPASTTQRRETADRVRGIMAQALITKHRQTPHYMSDEIKELLAKERIFTREDGAVVCPFVSKDAFRKAMAGKNSVLSGSHKNSIRQKDQLTIVDYSRPSNERRMFVLDLKTGNVLHNTWVAHGSGANENNQGPGVDGFGSSPVMSNTSGSRLSSDGFAIFTQAAVGKLWGPNVLMRGIDTHNGNTAARQIVLHGWVSPLEGYSKGLDTYDEKTEKFLGVVDPVKAVREMNFTTASGTQVRDALVDLRGSTYTSPYVSPTWGCLGVPHTPARHLDRRGRNKSQLELLREDLPGSLVFSYSGPEMKSRFF